MYGEFGTRMTVEGMDYSFILDMNVEAPATFVSKTNQVFQMWTGFEVRTWTGPADPLGFPTLSNPVNNSVMTSFEIT